MDPLTGAGEADQSVPLKFLGLDSLSDGLDELEVLDGLDEELLGSLVGSAGAAVWRKLVDGAVTQ